MAVPVAMQDTTSNGSQRQWSEHHDESDHRLIAIIAAIAGILASGIAAHGQAPKSIRIGYAISLSGPNAAGAGITVLPNYRLWVKEVNAAGGIMLKSIGKRVPIEVIEYDDHSNVDNAVAAVERLINRTRSISFFRPGGPALTWPLDRYCTMPAIRIWR